MILNNLNCKIKSKIMQKEKEIKIDIPNGWEIDKARSTFTHLILLEKTKVKSWKDLQIIKGYAMDLVSNIITMSSVKPRLIDVNTFATHEQVTATIALAKLSQVHPYYVGDWKADYTDNESKYQIRRICNKIQVIHSKSVNAFLSFPTKDIAQEFIENNIEDLENAKIFL